MVGVGVGVGVGVLVGVGVIVGVGVSVGVGVCVAVADGVAVDFGFVAVTLFPESEAGVPLSIESEDEAHPAPATKTNVSRIITNAEPAL